MGMLRAYGANYNNIPVIIKLIETLDFEYCFLTLYSLLLWSKV